MKYLIYLVCILAFTNIFKAHGYGDLKEICVHGTSGVVEKTTEQLTHKAYGWGLELNIFSYGNSWDNWVHYTFTLPTKSIKIKKLRFRYRKSSYSSQRHFGIWDIHLYSGYKKIEVIKSYQHELSIVGHQMTRYGDHSYNEPIFEVTKPVKKFNVLANILDQGFGVSLRVGPKHADGRHHRAMISTVCVSYEEVY